MRADITKPNYNISELTPAETWMILKPTWSLREDLLKYTIIDLILKKVLLIKKELLIRKYQRVKPKDYFFVKKGENFDSYSPQIHEQIITRFFGRSDDRYLIKVLLYNLYNVTEKLDLIKKNLVSKVLKKKGIMPQFSIANMFSSYQLTTKGKQKQHEIKSLLTNADKQIHIWTRDSNSIKSMFNKLGTNFILLKNLNFEISKTIKKTISDLDKQIFDDSYGWDSFLEYDMTLDLNLTFDDFSFDSDSDDGDIGDFDGD